MKLFKDKYRILEKDNMFYPQSREFFIWLSYNETMFLDVNVINFETLKEAEEFLEQTKLTKLKG